jgi:hypothetical protein
MTPPPFDPYRRRASDPEAKAFGYKFAAIDYDQTLGRYSDWLRTLPGQGSALLVVDVHSALNRHLAERRKEQVSYFLAGDAVHPNPTGHWLMAQTLLLGWNAPAVVAEAVIDARSMTCVSGDARDVTAAGEDGLAFTWRTILPLSVDPASDPASLALEEVNERLNRYRLVVRGLDGTKYTLLARCEGDGEQNVTVGEFDRSALEAGLDVASLPRFPTVAAARAVFERLLRHRQMTYDDWRKRIREQPGTDSTPRDPSAADVAELSAIRTRCQPRDIHIRLLPTPIPGKPRK